MRLDGLSCGVIRPTSSGETIVSWTEAEHAPYCHDVSEMSEAVSAVFADRRRELGLTLEQVGDRAGLHRTAVGLVERNLRSLTLDSADRIATALGLRLSQVVATAEESRSN
jgi:DNA-binding XRE family transcriptional regulator